MNFVRFDSPSALPAPVSLVLEKVEEQAGPFEYRELADKTWCIRTIPDKHNEQPLAVLGKTLESAANRMLTVLRVMR